MSGTDSSAPARPSRAPPPPGRRPSLTGGSSALAAVQAATAAAGGNATSLGQLSARAAASAAAIEAPASTTEVAIELPPNWERHADQEGKVYFYNRQTKETTWALPTAAAAAAAAAAAGATVATGAADVGKSASLRMETPVKAPSFGKRTSFSSPAFPLSAFPDTSDSFKKLPAAFSGADNLVMPKYLPTRASGVTLPSRLEVLGNRDYKLMAVANPCSGFHYDAETYCNKWCCASDSAKSCWCCCARTPSSRPVKQLFVLPYIFSKAMARVSIFVLLLLIFISVIQILNTLGGVAINVGRAWMVGTGCSLVVIFILSQRKYQPDGVMSFCRSMGVPDVEEMMFSYSWKVEEEAVRTLAKAVWEAGVGVWIDVVKLCPGDEIRPVVRTMVRSVYKCVVFISQPYITSPNCCVEFWEACQYPEKLIICILEPLPSEVMDFLTEMSKPRMVDGVLKNGSVIVDGLESLIPELDKEVENYKDRNAYKWWQQQNISGGGVPSNVVPNDTWSLIPTFSFTGRMFLPDRSISIGPLYLAGNCLDSGTRMRWPWLFLITLFGLGVNVIDMILKVFFADVQRTKLDYAWIVLIFFCDLAPLFAWKALWDTRVLCDASLRPLLASRALEPGVRVQIKGDVKDETAASLRNFLSLIGHLDETSDQVSVSAGHADDVEQLSVIVEVMSTLQDRDRLFGSDDFKFDQRRTLFVWTGSTKDGMPFGRNDPNGTRMMRFLVLIKDWEGDNLAESLFSAIGMRVVDVLHTKKDD